MKVLRIFVPIVIFGSLRVAGEFSTSYSRAEALGEENVEIYPNDLGHELRPLVMRIPERFRYGSSVGAQKSKGINIITFYPSFTGSEEPQNAPYNVASGCVGFCNGRILISVAYLGREFLSGSYSGVADSTAAAWLEWHHELYYPGGNPRPSYIHVIERESQFGFERVFDEIDERDAKRKRIDRYMMRFAEGRNHYDLVTHCAVSAAYQGCELQFSLACDPTVAVKVVSWPYDKMEEVERVRFQVDKFISGMVRNSDCVSREGRHVYYQYN